MTTKVVHHNEIKITRDIAKESRKSHYQEPPKIILRSQWKSHIQNFSNFQLSQDQIFEYQSKQTTHLIIRNSHKRFSFMSS